MDTSTSYLPTPKRSPELSWLKRLASPPILSSSDLPSLPRPPGSLLSTFPVEPLPLVPSAISENSASGGRQFALNCASRRSSACGRRGLWPRWTVRRTLGHAGSSADSWTMSNLALARLTSPLRQHSFDCWRPRVSLGEIRSGDSSWSVCVALLSTSALIFNCTASRGALCSSSGHALKLPRL